MTALETTVQELEERLAALTARVLALEARLDREIELRLREDDKLWEQAERLQGKIENAWRRAPERSEQR